MILVPPELCLMSWSRLCERRRPCLKIYENSAFWLLVCVVSFRCYVLLHQRRGKKQRRSHDGIEFHLWADFKSDACVIRTASLGRAQEISLVI